MTERDQRRQETRLEEILKSNLTSSTKIAAIIRIGFNDRVARGIVAQFDASRYLPAYYERVGPVSRSR